MVSDLTGLDIASASLLDEATAAAEAMALCRRSSKASDDAVFVIDRDCHPQTIAVVETRAEPLGLPVVVADVATDGLPDGDIFGVLLQYPASSGRIVDWRGVIARRPRARCASSVATDLLGALPAALPRARWAPTSPSARRSASACRWASAARTPASCRCARDCSARCRDGLVGVSIDADGDRAYRLALQTREQHIRREKATSNICTAQVLLAVMASMYAVYHGPDGLTAIAEQVHAPARCSSVMQGVELVHDTFFDTVRARVPGRAHDVVSAAADGGINLRLVDADTVGIACDEATTPEHLGAVCRAFGRVHETLRRHRR